MKHTYTNRRGETFTSLDDGSPEYGYIWPIEEFFSRVYVSNKMKKVLRRLNPNGKKEFDLPDGWPRHKRIYRRW